MSVEPLLRRRAGSLPYPDRAAGTADRDLPFDHLVVVMMENHSFDNLLGELPVSGQPMADGLEFAGGTAQNSNPARRPSSGSPDLVHAFPLTTTEQESHVTQSWNATHAQIDGGSMQGFVREAGSPQPMGYYTQVRLPFSYWLANRFAVANRWFCSAPCQTYPNRRFLMAGTAYGEIATTRVSLHDPPPPNGTIFDLMAKHEVSWRNYFTDVPSTMIIPDIIKRYWETNLRPVEEFVLDCKTGRLPSVSFVDPGLGAITDVGKFLVQHAFLEQLGEALEPISGSEEAPQDVAFGERWAYDIIRHVIRSPAWPRTLLIYTYDEHGGYYDHVTPPPAIPPDAIKPNLAAGDTPGGYDMYGPRVPAIIVSPYAKPHSVSDVVYDHTSVLATIEAKWNLPALTDRDANAHPVWDLLDFAKPELLKPGRITRPRGMLLEALLDLFKVRRPVGGLRWGNIGDRARLRVLGKRHSRRT
jgi:phospholipase C